MVSPGFPGRYGLARSWNARVVHNRPYMKKMPFTQSGIENAQKTHRKHSGDDGRCLRHSMTVSSDCLVTVQLFHVEKHVEKHVVSRPRNLANVRCPARMVQYGPIKRPSAAT